MDNFDPYNVLLAIATNIPVLLMTAFVVQGHIFVECKKIKTPSESHCFTGAHSFCWHVISLYVGVFCVSGDRAGHSQEASGESVRFTALAGGWRRHDHRLRDVPQPHARTKHQEQEAERNLSENSGWSRWSYCISKAPLLTWLWKTWKYQLVKMFRLWFPVYWNQ